MLAVPTAAVPGTIRWINGRDGGLEFREPIRPRL